MNKLLPRLALLAASISAPVFATTTVLDFSGTQYADNFTETSNGDRLSVNSDALQFSNISSLSGITVYNPVFPSADNTESFSLSVDAKFTTLPTSFGGDSVGLLTHLNGTTGYLAVFRINKNGSTSQADLHVFEGASTTGSTVGTQVGSTQSLISTGGSPTLSADFASNTFYSFNLSIDASAGTSIAFTASILDAGTQSVIGTFNSIIDNSPTLGGTENKVGLRLGTQGNINNFTVVDNFTLNTAAIPEPSAFAALGGLGALGFALARRRR
ncbi:MAG: PEP-CTERM sorting domain-containing protein [Verrucomicrobiota bacterium]